MTHFSPLFFSVRGWHRFNSQYIWIMRFGWANPEPILFYMLFILVESLRLGNTSRITESKLCPSLTFCFTDITLFCSVLVCSYSCTRFFCFVLLFKESLRLKQLKTRVRTIFFYSFKEWIEGMWWLSDSFSWAGVFHFIQAFIATAIKALPTHFFV